MPDFGVGDVVLHRLTGEAGRIVEIRRAPKRDAVVVEWWKSKHRGIGWLDDLEFYVA